MRECSSLPASVRKTQRLLPGTRTEGDSIGARGGLQSLQWIVRVDIGERLGFQVEPDATMNLNAAIVESLPIPAS